MSTRILTFNSPLEAGMRAVALLVAAYPQAYDLQRLVAFDYLVVHTGDLGGPESLHPKLPLRSAELLVRRELVSKGLMLMISRNLAERLANPQGISYRAGEMAEAFISTLTAPYLRDLIARAQWVIDNFGSEGDESFRLALKTLVGHWIGEFQAAQKSFGADV